MTSCCKSWINRTRNVLVEQFGYYSNLKPSHVPHNQNSDHSPTKPLGVSVNLPRCKGRVAAVIQRRFCDMMGTRDSRDVLWKWPYSTKQNLLKNVSSFVSKISSQHIYRPGIRNKHKMHLNQSINFLIQTQRGPWKTTQYKDNTITLRDACKHH